MDTIRTILLLIMGAFLGCAKEGFPPGGPEDKTPPTVIRTFPELNATMVDPELEVEVWFSESIQTSAASDAIFITPFPGDEVKYHFRGRRVKIEFPESLYFDRTYVVTFGTGIKDYRNNALEASFTVGACEGAR